MNRFAITLCLLAAVSVTTQGAEYAIDLDTQTGVIKGSLVIPEVSGPVPVVLLIAGSGPTDRDGNSPAFSGRNDSLKMLAASLAENGVASVRYDKRGIAASKDAGRSEADLRFDDYVQDAASWVMKLSMDARFRGIAVLGHSEGSLIGMIASQRSPAQAFISVAGSAEMAPTILRRQLMGRLPADLAKQNEEILHALENGGTVREVPPPLQALYRPSVQPYLMSWFRFSPTNELAKLGVPCLLMHGETDIQIGVVDARRLHAANPACTLRLVKDMNHVLKRVPSDQQKQIASYGEPLLPLDTDLVKSISEFLSSEQVHAAFQSAGRR